MEKEPETKLTWRERYAALKGRYQDLVAQFGAIALITHFSIGLLTFSSFAVMIEAGIEVEGAAEGSGVLASAWVAYKLTFPVRVMITLALTPIVAAGWYRLRGKGAAAPAALPVAEEAPKPLEP